MTERWLPVVGFEGFYEVSDQGRVRSMARTIFCEGRWGPREVNYKSRILALRTDPAGRLRVNLCDGSGVKLDRKVHRLVMQSFVGACPQGMEVCHNNGDSTDNRLSNLRYDTRSANELDKVLHGTHRNAAKTHCKHGHEFTPENTYKQTLGGRGCRTCNRRTSRNRQLAQASGKAS